MRGYEPAGHSATPIYDALCAEYRRLFRALPGDRSGEDELRFNAFGGVGFGREAGRDFSRDLGRDLARDAGRRHAGSNLPALPPGRSDAGGRRPEPPDQGRQGL